jgi:acetolactate synthase I/II/III large subunit
MQMTTVQGRQPVDVPAGIRDSAGRPEWGSDLIMDMLRLLDIEYAAVLPGSTFRGIHDSFVNYTANQRPEMILCNHEMITVSLARGYARATGKPMVAIVHDFVGLLNTTMTIYDAWCDRVPVIILGGTGPMDATKRRPWIDWIHSANVQANAVRDFTKWDDQPASVAAIPESMMRAYRIAVTEPAGPVYVNFDVDLQEEEISGEFPLPDVSRYRPAAPVEPDRGAVQEAARWLVSAELPLIFADRVGRHADSVRALVELAELLAAPVIDVGGRQSFPTPHALDFAGDEKSLIREADVVLGLDVLNLDGALRLPVNALTRAAEKVDVQSQRVISMSLDELNHRGLTLDYQALPTVDLPMLGETRLGIPRLLEACQSLLDSNARTRIDRRRTALEGRQEKLRAKHRAYVEANWDHPQITETRLAAEVWEAMKGEDFVLTQGRYRRMAPGVMQISGPEQFLGEGGGGAVGARPGLILGSGLALRDSGKLPVAITGDGDLLASIQALWTAAHYRIPTLLVVNNNRSYYNDEAHQDRIAKLRDRPPENRWIGQRLENPELDYGAIARDFGVYGEGPIKNAGDLQGAFKRAIEAVKQGEFAVVDVWTENRDQP